jgi:hypothetical protein
VSRRPSKGTDGGTVIFEPLPHRAYGVRAARRAVWVARLEPLMDRPMEWARVATRPTRMGAAGAVNALKHGRLEAPPGKWEFAARTVDGEHRVYARYMGPVE